MPEKLGTTSTPMPEKSDDGRRALCNRRESGDDVYGLKNDARNCGIGGGENTFYISIMVSFSFI